MTNYQIDNNKFKLQIIHIKVVTHNQGRATCLIPVLCVMHKNNKTNFSLKNSQN